MNDTTTNKPPVWFWILSVLALLWNLMGLAVFGLTVAMMFNQEMLSAALEGDAAKIDLVNATPLWVNIAFGVAVVFGVLGSIALLLKKRLAFLLFVISLLGVLVQNVYVFFMSNTVDLMGVGMSPLVIAIAIVLLPFTTYCTTRFWLK